MIHDDVITVKIKEKRELQSLIIGFPSHRKVSKSMEYKQEVFMIILVN